MPLVTWSVHFHRPSILHWPLEPFRQLSLWMRLSGGNAERRMLALWLKSTALTRILSGWMNCTSWTFPWVVEEISCHQV
jgi:hypothetical protein